MSSLNSDWMKFMRPIFDAMDASEGAAKQRPGAQAFDLHQEISLLRQQAATYRAQRDELLAALRIVEDAPFRKDGDDTTGGRFINKRQMDMIRAAIAKAEGRSA